MVAPSQPPRLRFRSFCTRLSCRERCLNISSVYPLWVFALSYPISARLPSVLALGSYSLKLTRVAYYRILRKDASRLCSSPPVRRHLIRESSSTTCWDLSYSLSRPVSADCSSICSDRSSAINRLRQIIPDRRERSNLPKISGVILSNCRERSNLPENTENCHIYRLS